MTTITYPSFPPLDQLVGRVRTTDYRRLALSIWSAIVTTCIYTYIAGQLTRRAVNFLLPHLITILRTSAIFLESTLLAQHTTTLSAPPQPKRSNAPRATKATRRASK